MGVNGLNAEQTKDMYIHVAKGMVGKKDILTKADQAIGDGDHGIGMARGFEAVEKKLGESSFESIDGVIKAIGMAMMMNMGGASGAIFGTLFKAGGKNLIDKLDFDGEALSILLKEGLQAVKDRGGAKAGDKTMIDSLEPASETASQNSSKDLQELLAEVVASAQEGVEKTKDMVATTGKAKTLGERSLGHPDPGAMSMLFILELMAEYVNDKVAESV